MRKFVLLAVGAGIAILPAAAGAQQPGERWQIHEWGTFTALQNETGHPLGWINTEDEPVPSFCHRLSHSLLVPVDDLAPTFFKDAPRAHPDVILRLETPVLYFHPPASATLPQQVDVKVEFRGGWLTEYYPDANVGAPGLTTRSFQYGHINASTQGSLEWKGLQIGKEGTFPATEDPVWLSPRNVRAASLTAAGGESERFLFYRGVAYTQAPLLVQRSGDGTSLNLESWLPDALKNQVPLRIPRLWLADIREDGTTGFRTLPPQKIATTTIASMTTIRSTFEPKDYSLARLSALRSEMHDGLVAEGLHSDEAEALLNTWDASYFRSSGLRLFFLVPRAWTDYVLPLRTSLDADVKRVMIGRLELITPDQRRCLQRIAETKAPTSAWFEEWTARNPDAWKRYQQKREEGNLRALREEKIEIPDDYRAYLELGRFRNAIVLDEFQRTQGEGLRKFIDAYDLHEARVGDKPARER
ncbi:MAG TPA: hypothetical protein VKU80_00605 [Planctomycetota bacterium]|nr:hypothetical protein [Planctomycetota bacterium]